jgi:putative phosphoribosyl transferase
MFVAMDATLDIPVGDITLPGDLLVPERAHALVIFAHGSGSSRKSPRNQLVAEVLREQGDVGTLLFDLLTPAEDVNYANRFDIGLLAERLMGVTAFILGLSEFAGWPIGYFGASTGAAAAIMAAAELPNDVQAVVSRGGRPDLAKVALDRITAPTLLIVGGHDAEVLEMNEAAFDRMLSLHKKLEVVPGATHLFEEPGTLEIAATLARHWFERFLVRQHETVPRD